MNKRVISDKSGLGRAKSIRRAALAAAAALSCALMLLTGCKKHGPVAVDQTADPTHAPKLEGLSAITLNEAVSSNAFCHIDPVLGAADWVELINLSSEQVDISGWRMAGNAAMRDSFTFPEGTVMQPGGILAVFCISGYDGSENSDSLVAPFGISRTGEKIYLSDGGANPASFEIPGLTSDISWARADDGSCGFSWTPTFGEPNSNIAPTLDEALASAEPVDGLRFSELVTGSLGWVELENVSSEELDLSLFAISDDPASPVKWRFPSMKLAPGELVVVELNDASPEAPLSASFKVSHEESAIYLFDIRRSMLDSFEVDPAMPAGVSAVRSGDTVAYTAYPTKSEPNSDRTFDAISWTAMDLSTAPLYINEVCPDNKYGITDKDGDRSDWVELINVSDNPVNLSGYYLSDDESDPLKWQLPNVALEPKGYALIFLSGKDISEGSEIHASFSLSKEDGGIWLSRLDGMQQDTIPIPEDLNPNVSIGRNGSNAIRYYAAPTPGGPNSSYGTERSADAGGFNARSVYISEVSAVAPARSGEDDWVELYNGSGSSMKLEGWSLTDDPAEPKKFKLDSITISAGGYAVIRCSKSGGGKAPFGISNGGDTLFLINSYGAVCDVFDTGATAVGVTTGRAYGSDDGKRCFFAKPTRGSKNAAPMQGYAAEPAFSKTGLYYDSAFSVELICSTVGASIRYTTDGSEPTESSKLYEGPIKISSNTVIRARSFCEGLIPSFVASHTFLIRDEHTLPVVCITLSKSDYSRMYVSHMNSNGGVTKGEEVGCFMEYYVDGRLAVSSGAGVRVSGASTSVYSQKSLGLFFRAGYGRSSLDFPFFDGCKISSFRSLTLRNGGQDQPNARIRDTFVSTICQGLKLDVANVRPVIVYINGQYRGIYDLKENMNEDFVAAHHGVSRDKVETARRNGYMKAGNKEQWKKMLDMCRTLDFSDQSNFDALAKLVDVDSIKDYLIARTYFYDYDMYNQMYWHTNDNKVKWRAVLFDSDFAMAGNSSSANMLSVYFNRNGHVSPHGYVTQLDIFCALNQNKKWREEFIVRYIWAVKYRFNAEKAQATLDRLAALYRPEMKEHINKWGRPASYSKWDNEIATFRLCLGNRPAKALENLRRFYGLSEAKFKELEKLADKMAGH